MQLTFFHPLLWLFALAALALFAWRYSLVDRTPRLKWASFALRAIGILLLILALCRPSVPRSGKDLHVVFLLDVSESVDLGSAIERIDQIEAGIESLGRGDSWSIFAIADSVRPFADTDELRSTLTGWQEGIADDRFRAASRLGKALDTTRIAFPAGKRRRVILMSDGQETHRELDQALATLQKEQVDVQFLPVDPISTPEAAVTSITSNSPSAFEGEVVRLKVRASANREMLAKLRILHRGVVVQERNVQLDGVAPATEEFDVEMVTPGNSLWTAELLPAEDHFPLNNQLTTGIRVRGKPSVLALHREPKDLRPIARVLREQDFSIDVRGNKGLPDTLEGMLAFDAIMLADIPATDLSTRQMELLKLYTTDFGGGLIMTGSENSFGLGGYYRSPVEEVLPLISRFEKEKSKPSLAMTLVIDKSGSMSGVAIALARQAAKASVELLGPQDQVGVIGFDSNPQIVSEMRPATESGTIMAAIDSLAAGGGTDLFPAMVAGKDMLDNTTAKIKHMIVLSDGQTGAADFESLTQAMTDAGVTVSTVALGEGAARELLAAIAELGRGRYYETVDPSTVPQIFTKETMQASKSAIKEDLYGTVQSGDHPALAGYEEAELPFTLGYVMTEPKPASQVLLVAETGDPLLAIGRFGLGIGMAYSSDLTERWGGEWLAWDGCGKFWAQAFRAVLRKSDAQGLRVTQHTDGETWRLDITRVDDSGSPVSGIAWDAQLITPGGGKAVPLTVKETGLGRYQASAPIAGLEKASLRLHDRDHDKLKTLHYERGYPAEYRLNPRRPDAIANLQEFLPESLDSGLEPVETRVSIAPAFCLAALLSLLAGILLRRL